MNCNKKIYQVFEDTKYGKYIHIQIALVVSIVWILEIWYLQLNVIFMSIWNSAYIFSEAFLLPIIQIKEVTIVYCVLKTMCVEIFSGKICQLLEIPHWSNWWINILNQNILYQGITLLSTSQIWWNSEVFFFEANSQKKKK